MQEHYKNIVKASLLIALSGVLYGFLGYLGTSVLRENISIATMLFWRFFIAGSWILFFVLRKYMQQGAIHTISKQTAFLMFLLGAIGYAGSSVFYFIASEYTGTGLAMVMFFSYPIIVALMSWAMTRQRIGAHTIAMLFVMVVGFFLLEDSSTQQIDVLGIIFGVIASLCYAIYVVGSKRVTSIQMDSNVLTTIVCFGCAAVFLLLSIASNSFVVPASLKGWGYLVALGVLATAVPIQLMLEGLKYVSSMRASIISVIEPLITVFVGVLLLDESISQLQLIGAIIILSSALFVQLQKEL